MTNMPDLKLHTRVRDFFNDKSVPLWMKLIHLFVFIDAKNTRAKNGYTVYYQNPGLIKRFTITNEYGQVVWEPSLESIQKSLAKLVEMQLIERDVLGTGERRIKLNRPLVLKFLRQHSIDTDLYRSFKLKSRERKLIRRKIITAADYLNQSRFAQNESFKNYLEYQHRKYGYDIKLPDIEIFEVNFNIDRFITPEELEFFRDYKRIDDAISAIYDAIPHR